MHSATVGFITGCIIIKVNTCIFFSCLDRVRAGKNNVTGIALDQ